jgi:hypothetical protein
MSLHEAVGSYVRARADRIQEADARRLLDRAPAGRAARFLRRPGVNATTALVLVLLLTLGAVAVQLRWRWVGTDVPVAAQLPDEVIDLVDRDAKQLTPFRLRDHRVLPPQPSGIAAKDSQLAGRVVQVFPDAYVPRDLLASHDGRSLYAIRYRMDNSSGYTRFVMDKLYFIDLQSGNIQAELPLNVIADEPSGGAMALSPDGRTLYVNQMTGLALFDTQSFSLRAVVAFDPTAASPRASRPWWSFLMLSAEAKGVLGTPGIAADPRGRWVAALGSPPAPKAGVIGAGLPLQKGIWLVDVQRTPHLAWQLHPKQDFRALAASLDGSAVYALEGSVEQHILVIDSASGKDLGKFLVCSVKLYFSNSCSDRQGFAGVRPASAIAP